jgi:hypothetical protein
MAIRLSNTHREVTNRANVLAYNKEEVGMAKEAASEAVLETGVMEYIQAHSDEIINQVRVRDKKWIEAERYYQHPGNV